MAQLIINEAAYNKFNGVLRVNPDPTSTKWFDQINHNFTEIYNGISTLLPTLVYTTDFVVTFNTPNSIAYTTAVPFDRALTIIAGKSLDANDVFTVVAGGYDGAGAQISLIGDGSHAPVLTAFDFQVGTYNTTVGVYNLLTFEYVNGQYWVSIVNGTAI